MASYNQSVLQNRKPRSYYVDFSKKQSTSTDKKRRQINGYNQGNLRFKETPELTLGHRGFLITSQDECKSYLEMRHILSEYIDLLYANKTSGKSGETNGTNNHKPNRAETLEDEIELELKQLRFNRPLKQVKTYCRNSIFINLTPDFRHIDPRHLVDRFFDEMLESKQVRTRNTFKVLPILDTFRNNTASAKESLTNLLNTTFSQVTCPKKYFIEFQSRGNYKLQSDDRLRMIEGIADAVSSVKPNWTVSRDEADYMIILVALKNVCCMSIVEKYFDRSKYNVMELCKDFSPAETSEVVEKTNDDQLVTSGTSSSNEAYEANLATKKAWRNANAVCFDVDSTVCCDEAIDELAKFVGKSKEVSDITRDAMMGGADFRDALARRLAIIQPSSQILTEYLESHPPRLTPGIEKLVARLHKLGVDLYLVSGGFDVIIQPVAEKLNIPKKNVYANGIRFFFDGAYAGFDETRPTSNQDGKSRVIAMLKKEHGYKNVVMIGDGVTDLEACPPADVFIGFGGNQVRETVKAKSHWFVHSFEELLREISPESNDPSLPPPDQS